jgi:hypothetical protein
VNENSALRVKVAERKTAVCRAEGGNIVFVSTTTNNNPQGGLLMKRFLGVLIASMFLSSAAFAADAMKDEKVKSEKTEKAAEKGEKTKGEKGEKSKGAKSKSEKGESTKSEKAKEKPDSKM